MSGGMPLLHPYAFMAYTGQLYLHFYTLKTSSASSLKIYVGNDHKLGAFPTTTLLTLTAYFSERLISLNFFRRSDHPAGFVCD